MTRTSVLSDGRWSAVTTPWPSDRQTASFRLVRPAGGREVPVDTVAGWLQTLGASGVTRVVTPPLPPHEATPLLAAGFTLHEELRLLGHRMLTLPDPTPVPGLELVRARRRHRQKVLAIDAGCFDQFWRFDPAALAGAVAATPRSRFRVATLADCTTCSDPSADDDRRTIPDPAALEGWPERPAGASGPEVGAGGAGRRSRSGGESGGPGYARADETGSSPVIGYAITGRAGRSGFLQRIGVDEAVRRRGVGRALVLDGLQWLLRRGVSHTLVNTQPSNTAALSLYEALGFRDEPHGLCVLSASLAT